MGLTAGENTISIINVRGMKDKDCVEKITDELQKIDGVNKISVKLESGQVIVEHNTLEVSSLNAAIVKAGFKIESDKTKRIHGVEMDKNSCTEEEKTGCNKPCSGER